MFKGGQKRLLPPIKNPLFNPNEDDGNEVRIATVVSQTFVIILLHMKMRIFFFECYCKKYILSLQKNSSEKTKGGRLSNLFGSRQRKSSRGSHGVESEDEKASGSSRPSSSDITTASSLNSANKKDLPKLGKADQPASSTSARSILSSRNKFSRNLTPSCTSGTINNEDETNGNLETPVSTSSDGRHSGLLKRGKERPPSLLNKDTVESSRSPDKRRPPSCSVPSECDQGTRKAQNSVNTPVPDETKQPKYQDALSLRYEN